MIAPKAGYLTLLGLRVPRRLALASIPADFADWLDYAAIVGLLVFAWGEGPFVLALFGFALSLPYLTIGPLLAIYVDRTPLGRVLVLSNLGRGLTTLALAFAGNTALVLLLVFVRSSIDSAFTPARQTAIQISTPPELLGSANGLHQAINQTSKIAGPALGGLLLAVMPVQGVFGINAILSLIAALSLVRLGLPPRETPEAKDFRSEMTVGVNEFRRNRLLLLVLVFSAIAYFAFFLYDALLALLAQDFGLGVTAFGIGIAASGAGGLIGALLAGRFSSHPIASMAGSAMFSGCVTIAIALAAIGHMAVPAGVYFLALGLMGGSTAFMVVPYRTIVQQQTPPDRIARVFAAGEAIIVTVMLLAPFIGSLIATAYGTGAAFLGGGALVLLLGLATAIGLARRSLP